MSLSVEESSEPLHEDSSRSPSFKGALQQFNFAEDASSAPVSVPLEPLARMSTPTLSLKRSPSDTSRSPDRTVSQSTPSAGAKRRKRSSGYAPPSTYKSLTNNLTDSLAHNLINVFIGVNPGIRTATSGHAYAHPSNLFWKLLHSSGCTPRLCRPEEDQDLPKLFQIGNTNIVTRPTKDASQLSKGEMDAGVAVLEAKIALYRPEAVTLVGKGIWESVWRVKHGRGIKKEEFNYGWQKDSERLGAVEVEGEIWPGAKIFVATTTSGLAAGMKLKEKEEVWRGLGEWVERRRAGRNREGDQTVS